MKQHHWQIRLALCVGLGCCVMTTGCRTAQHATQAPTREVFVPPFADVGPAIAPAGAGNLMTASSPRPATTAAHSVPLPALPLVPDLPEAASPVSYNSVAAQPHEPGPHAAHSNQHVPGAAPIQQIRNDIDCLPPDAAWRKQVDDQSTSMAKRLTSLEAELTTTRASLQNVNQSLLASQGKIEQLNHEVVKWQGEVQRLEAEMKSQQLADLKSLDELTETMHRILTKQRPDQTVRAESLK